MLRLDRKNKGENKMIYFYTLKKIIFGCFIGMNHSHYSQICELYSFEII